MPPTFTKSLRRVDANIGNDASLDCKVSGSQPMTIAWFKDDQEITAGHKFQAGFKDQSATLQITGLEKADSGVYKCRATNSAGFKETSGTLYVKGYPCLAHARPLCCLKVFNDFQLTGNKPCLVASRASNIHRETRGPGRDPRQHRFLQSCLYWDSSINCQVVQGRQRDRLWRNILHKERCHLQLFGASVCEAQRLGQIRLPSVQ